MRVFTCEICGKEIPTETVRIAKRLGRDPKFCSLECSANRRDRAHKYDHTFLNEDNEFSAYFIGLFVTDGHFSKDKRTVIGLVDKDLMEDIYRRVKHIGKLRVTLPDLDSTRKIKLKKPFYSLCFGGDVSKRISDLGYSPGAKTGKEFVPDRCKSDFMFPHFYRGVLDGDGCIVLQKDGTLDSVICSSSKIFLDELFVQLQSRKIVRGGSVIKSRPNFYVLVFSHFDTVSICNYIYKDATIYLDRKYQKFLSGKDYDLKLVIQKNATCSVEGCNKPCKSRDLCYEHYSKMDSVYRRIYMREAYLKQRRLNYMKHAERERLRSKQWKQDHSEQVLEYKRKYDENHRDEINAYKSAYRVCHHDQVREQEKASYERNKDQKLARAREYKEEHKEEISTRNAEYREKNREKLNNYFSDRYQKNKEEIKVKRRERYAKQKAEKEAAKNSSKTD